MTTQVFPSIPELDNQFLSLFPHRWDYIWAEHARPDETPNWQTESRYPLADRTIQQGKHLYGVRFGGETQYFMLDIDKSSVYHPKRDPFAFGRIVAALEILGFTDYVAITSSYSGGVHLYFPLPESVPTWELATVVTHRLTCAGFLVEDGLLEVFPNVRNYDPKGPTLFKGHRLPLQAGSYLLTKGMELAFSSPEKFCAYWAFCQYRNQVNPVSWRLNLEDATRKTRKMSYKAKKFLDDLNNDVETGWTAHGQTNYILGRITLRAYVFGHVIQGGEPLDGDRLVNEIVRTATQLPGYQEWCRHQTEIYSRSEEWARCAENSHYYPYGNPKSKQAGGTAPHSPTIPTINWNEWQKERARERLCFAIADLLNRDELPVGARDRFLMLTGRYGFSGETLYKPDCLDLWHPDYLWKTPSDSPNSFSPLGAASAEGALPLNAARSLFAKSECNPIENQGLTAVQRGANHQTGRNTASSQASSDFTQKIDPSKWWIDAVGDGGGGNG